MTIWVIAPGMFTTVQDLGRPGYGPLGVSPSGAADPLALRIGNRIVGNPEGAAALEMTLLGGTFQFSERGRVALTGSDCSLPAWQPIEVAPGEILQTGPLTSGARTYLCVRGGIDVPLVLGSASTHVLSGMGGFEGRALRKGDSLHVGSAAGTGGVAHVPFEYRRTLRITAGPQWDDFSGIERGRLFEDAYRVGDDSNRMGLRLSGAAIAAPHHGEMASQGVSLGAIQVPASGQPIILFVEAQTTGGYPIVANIIAADLPSAGQLRPRDEICFELVSIPTALRLLREQEALL